MSSQRIRDILTELQRRKDVKEDPCASCDATGKYLDAVCIDCLGQGVLLTHKEYRVLMTVASRTADKILDQQEFDYLD